MRVPYVLRPSLLSRLPYVLCLAGSLVSACGTSGTEGRGGSSARDGGHDGEMMGAGGGFAAGDGAVDDGGASVDMPGPARCPRQAPGTSVLTSSAGVLTNLPGLDFQLTGGPFEMRAANVFIERRPAKPDDLSDLVVYGTVENTDSVPRCFTTLDLRLGDTFVLGFPAGQPFRDHGRTEAFVRECVGPGELAPFWTFPRAVLTEHFEGELAIAYAAGIEDTPDGALEPHPATPSVAVLGRGEPRECGAVVTLSATAAGSDVHALSVAVFVLDARGLLVDFALANYPQTIEAGQSVTFRTGRPLLGGEVLVGGLLFRGGAADDSEE